MSDAPRKCIVCNGEGGDYDRRDYPPSWKRCTTCYGFGLRSDAADRWFARIVVTMPPRPLPSFSTTEGETECPRA